ncbi:iron-containing redox enzyme family protein [Jeongeupia naejangsanensis]|uniref:Iron-containing redox enzyme family protein n=1 Tax=Jeongeupia naejangsanensis TaxID=613195 RepID=A0ABS2BKV4_9NEIS|nr:iron-containing redox enzyme family protein [Jeongeupia naejangsanensis]MBM3116250.1 iron-containing redox enzyme family protein [Jeongeupia naejangsanensis]
MSSISTLLDHRTSPDPVQHEQAFSQFASHPLFDQPQSFYCDSPYVRPVRPQDLHQLDFDRVLTQSELNQPSHLMGQRLLLNIYEQDLVFLPQQGKLVLPEFNAFYDEELRRAGAMIRPELERHVFGWLDDAVSISGNWDVDTFKAYADEVLDKIAHTPSSLVDNIRNSRDPANAARFFLIQCAGDFLSEASAMARNVLGNFGPAQSELFKILIDEYGYGVPQKKHSVIFESLLTQCGLNPAVHHYWQFYTATSLALTNYFHYVSANHRHLFRYLGALFYTEASLALVTRGQAEAMRIAFGDSVDTLYFDEHAHIDVHHGKMAFEQLIRPVVAQYGKQVLPDIIRGFEEFRLLQDVADAELFAHIAWHDELAGWQPQPLPAQPANAPSHTFHECRDDLSVTHVHGATELFVVDKGTLKLVCSPFTQLDLGAGQHVVIPRGMLHGSVITAEHCSYTVTSLEQAA